MSKEWHVLSKLCAGRAVEILRARLVEQDVVVEGPFELPPLARLSSEDQTAFQSSYSVIEPRPERSTYAT